MGDGFSYLILYCCEQNNTARNEIYQRHRHLNLPLDQKFPQARHNFEINLMSFYSTEYLMFMELRLQMTTKTFDRMRQFQNKVRFSVALLLLHTIIQDKEYKTSLIEHSIHAKQFDKISTYGAVAASARLTLVVVASLSAFSLSSHNFSTQEVGWLPTNKQTKQKLWWLEANKRVFPSPRRRKLRPS